MDINNVAWKLVFRTQLTDDFRIAASVSTLKLYGQSKKKKKNDVEISLSKIL